MAAPLTLNPITAKSKGEVRRLRLSGFVPVSIQHKGMATGHYQQESKALNEFLAKYGKEGLVDLVIAPENVQQKVLIQSVSRNPISQQLLQVTFQQIRSDDTLKTHVVLLFTGEPEAVRLGQAIVQHQMDRINIECHQDYLPDHITIDISDLNLGQVIRVSDLAALPHVKILASPETVLVSLTSTRASIAEAEAVTEAAAEAKAAAAEEA